MSYKCDKVQQVNVTVFSRSSSAILTISYRKKEDNVSSPGAETPLDETNTTNLPTETTLSLTTSSTPTTLPSATTPSTTTTSSIATTSSTITTSSTTAPGDDFSSWLSSALDQTPPQSKIWVVVDKTTNETCILAQITSQFNLSYPVEIKANASLTSGNTTIIVPLDNSTETTGLCTNTSQSITLKWDENSVEIDFQLDEDKHFYVSPNKLNLTGQQNCSGKETVLTYRNDATLFKTQVDMSYECKKVPAVIITAVSGDSSAILSISHTKFKAFRKRKYNASAPGLVFRPMPPDTNDESNLIWINPNDEQNIQLWTNQIDEFLEEYKKPRSWNVQYCGYDRWPRPGNVCEVNLDKLGHCISSNKYSYRHGDPCIFLKLNKIYGWKPIMYNETKAMPDEIPQGLKDTLRVLDKFHMKWMNTVWVSCEGENPADVENTGKITYFPFSYIGFPEYFFPYLNQEGYVSPIVAVHFEKPTPGVRINIVCKVWLRNLDNDGPGSPGSVHFAIMVDKKLPTPDNV